MKNEGRSLAVDALRVFSVFFVIFNHTNDNGFFLFAKQEIGSLPFWGYAFISVFCKFAVPVFFAVSGALLLKKEETIREIYLHRVLRIVLTLTVFSLVFYFVGLMRGNGKVTVARFFQTMYSEGWNFSFWYLYAYIGFLISLPFLRAMVAKMENHVYIYMILLVILLEGVLPALEYWYSRDRSPLNSSLKESWFIDQVVVYPCIGYYLFHRVSLRDIKKNLHWLWIANLAAIMASCFLTYYKAMVTGECGEFISQTFHTSFVIVNCVTLCLTFRYFFETHRLSEWMQKAIMSLGKCTFGIYLLHTLFLGGYISEFNKLWDPIRQIPHMNPMIATMMICLCILLICYAITLILKKIPGIRKLLS